MVERVLSGETQMFEFEVPRRDGSVRQMHVHYIPHRADAAAVLGYIAVMTDVTERNHAVAERAMLEASERERRRIGQDLHDSLGQELTGLSLMAQNVADELRDGGHRAVETAEELARGLRGALQRVRRMSRGLVPIDEVDRRGLIVALENLAAQTDEAGSLACVCDVFDSVDIPSTETATHLYRIAQEAVANATKHADARHVVVSLRQRGSTIELAIRDDGHGLVQERRGSAGMGLRIMRYRADRIGGILTIASQPGQGTEVLCTLPSRKN
jgi:two-component system CheB/CheR fusion protein